MPAGPKLAICRSSRDSAYGGISLTPIDGGLLGVLRGLASALPRGSGRARHPPLPRLHRPDPRRPPTSPSPAPWLPKSHRAPGWAAGSLGSAPVREHRCVPSRDHRRPCCMRRPRHRAQQPWQQQQPCVAAGTRPSAPGDGLPVRTGARAAEAAALRSRGGRPRPRTARTQGLDATSTRCVRESRYRVRLHDDDPSRRHTARSVGGVARSATRCTGQEERAWQEQSHDAAEWAIRRDAGWARLSSRATGASKRGDAVLRGRRGLGK